MHDLAVEEIGDGREPDMRMRAPSCPRRQELGRPHLVEEDERPDHAAASPWQGAPHRSRRYRRARGTIDQLDRVAHAAHRRRRDPWVRKRLLMAGFLLRLRYPARWRRGPARGSIARRSRWRRTVQHWRRASALSTSSGSVPRASPEAPVRIFSTTLGLGLGEQRLQLLRQRPRRAWWMRIDSSSGTSPAKRSRWPTIDSSLGQRLLEGQ